jgi:hypothetical protein
MRFGNPDQPTKPLALDLVLELHTEHEKMKTATTLILLPDREEWTGLGLEPIFTTDTGPGVLRRILTELDFGV